MIRIVVLADTHMPRKGRVLPPVLFAEMRRSDLVIHLGDFTEVEVVDSLRAVAPLYGVHGNNDSDEVRLQFPSRQRIAVGPHWVTLLHGDVGGPTARQAAERVVDSDVVLFGHSHAPHCAWRGKTLFFNPGSPTDPRWGPTRCFGVLDVDDTVHPALIRLP